MIFFLETSNSPRGEKDGKRVYASFIVLRSRSRRVLSDEYSIAVTSVDRVAIFIMEGIVDIHPSIHRDWTVQSLGSYKDVSSYEQDRLDSQTHLVPTTTRPQVLVRNCGNKDADGVYFVNGSANNRLSLRRG